MVDALFPPAEKDREYYNGAGMHRTALTTEVLILGEGESTGGIYKPEVYRDSSFPLLVLAWVAFVFLRFFFLSSHL
jgi:hypothetical protein